MTSWLDVASQPIVSTTEVVPLKKLPIRKLWAHLCPLTLFVRPVIFPYYYSMSIGQLEIDLNVQSVLGQMTMDDVIDTNDAIADLG